MFIAFKGSENLDVIHARHLMTGVMSIILFREKTWYFENWKLGPQGTNYDLGHFDTNSQHAGSFGPDALKQSAWISH